MSGIGRLSGIALDCPDPAGLAAFYSQVIGWPIVFASPGFEHQPSPDTYRVFADPAGHVFCLCSAG